MLFRGVFRQLVLSSGLMMVLGSLVGCQHYGPRTITADRIPYNNAIASTWKQQTLLNVVRLRYFDTPVFVDVSQITSGYTLQSAGGATGAINPSIFPSANLGERLGAGINYQSGYQDRPTISYTPQTGSQYIKGLTTQINPGSLLYLIQSGYPADAVFELTVDSINGIRNRSFSGGQLRAADPEFGLIIDTIRRAQVESKVGVRVEHDKEKNDVVSFWIQDKEIDVETAKALQEVRKILRLDLHRSDFRVTVGAVAANANELAIQLRSALRIMMELSTYVEAPQAHLEDGRAVFLEPVEMDRPAPFRVLSGCECPGDAYVAVCYEGHWFWIENSDFRSKRTMLALMVLLALSDTGAKDNMPVVTIQAN